MCQSTGGSTGVGWRGRQETVRPIRFGTYNTRNGRSRGLKSALCRMFQANMDLGVFQETKFTKGIHLRKSCGHKLVASKAPSAHIGGVTVFYRAVEE